MADGKMDWDYTEFGRNLLAKAEAQGADTFMLKTLPTTLPERGERPPITIRVGGKVQSDKLIKQPAPRYPISARDQGIQGTVRLAVLIGLDGKVLSVRAEQGPPELIQSAVETFRQWEYKPTLVSGKPCFVITAVDVNYNLR